MDLVIDHSVQVDAFGNATRLRRSTPTATYERNGERYGFLRWGQQAFDNLRVVPPATGICHQVNLEYLGQVVFRRERRRRHPGLPGHPCRDRLAHDDDQRARRAGLGRWRHRGRGGDAGPADLDAAAAGRRLQALRRAAPRARPPPTSCSGSPRCCASTASWGSSSSSTAPGLHTLGLADRATIGNMSPEFGSTCAIFPVDAETLRYLEFTGRPTDLIELVDAYAREQGMFHDRDAEDPTFCELLELDLSDVQPSIAGPKRPQDRIALADAKTAFLESLGVRPRGRREPGQRHYDEAVAECSRHPTRRPRTTTATPASPATRAAPPSRSARRRGRGHARGRPRVRARPRPRRDRGDHQLHEHLEPHRDGRRRPAREEGGRARPRAQAVGEDLPGAGLDGRHRLPRAGGPRRIPRQARLQPRRLRLHDVHRELGPAARGDLQGRQRQRPRGLLGPVRQPQLRGPDQPGRAQQLPGVAAAVRRICPGRADGHRPLEGAARHRRGRRARLPARHLADERRDQADGLRRGPLGDVHQELRGRLHRRRRAGRRSTSPRATATSGPDSTYVRQPPYFEDMDAEPRRPEPIAGARVLAVLGDSVTTDHISPAGAIKRTAPPASG